MHLEPKAGIFSLGSRIWKYITTAHFQNFAGILVIKKKKSIREQDYEYKVIRRSSKLHQQEDLSLTGQRLKNANGWEKNLYITSSFVDCVCLPSA